MLAVAAILLVLSNTGGEASAPTPPTDGETSPPSPLTDGEAFVFVSGVNAGGLLVDSAEMLTGDAARTAAIEDGSIAPDEDLPNDFYIRNPETVGVAGVLAEDVTYTVLEFDADGQLLESEISHEEFASLYEDADLAATVYGFVPDAFPVTITVDNGLISRVVQVYLP